MLAVHELAANAIRHGAGRGRLRMWDQDRAVCCQVQDAGRAPRGVRPGAHEKAGGAGWRYVRSWPVAGPAAGGPDERDLRAGRDMRDGAVRAGLIARGACLSRAGRGSGRGRPQGPGVAPEPGTLRFRRGGPDAGRHPAG